MQKNIAQQLLQEYQNQLDQYYLENADATIALNQWLSVNFSKEQLCQFLQALLADESSLNEIAARSYQHGNGFLKVVLLDRGYKLRLHIWFAGQSCEENIHDHRWSFSSLILAGQLTSEIWKDDIQGKAFQEFEYHAATKQDKAFKQEVGQNHLKLDHVRINQTGECYLMPKGQLHRIINHGDQLVATIMCSAPTEQGTTRLIPIHQGIDPNIQPPKINMVQLQTSLQLFLSHLNKETYAHAA
ncbi:hypothetical protein MMP74_18180 [Acinetobacter sp. NIPH 1869]|uniref:hypothetical protein n=1 Tax=Acinetobacter higginsii TaxID=70347 RepID=UPI001F4B83ED|nr:hypothetical protein [Acinetobacter higginsii]MCH7306279.1 hypothetical protein [Acinetobacter higginsii]